MRDLFGSMNVCAVTDFPCHLKELSSRIPGLSISAEQLLYGHTLLPYYLPFFPEERIEKIINEMLYCDGKSLYMKMGLPASGIKNPAKLMYCPVCVVNDREQFGAAYWHRSHQLPFVRVCHKHHVLLLNSVVNFASRRNKHEYIALESVIDNTTSETHDSFLINDNKIAEISYQILNTKNLKFRAELLHALYLNQIKKRGEITYNGSIKFNKVVPAFVRFYGEGYLYEAGSFCGQTYDTWFHKVLRESEYVCHPLRHILLHIFFGLNVSASLNQSETYKASNPFGEGPWPCLNMGAQHYKELIVTSCDVTQCTDTGRPVGTFRCNCDFIYSRRGPDESETDIWKIGRIKQFGEVWRAKLQELSQDPSLSLRAKARLLGVDPKTIKSQYEQKDKVSKQCFISANIESKPLVLEKRTQWLEMNELKYLSKANDSYRALYSWLYKNDKEWLRLNKPITRRLSRKRNRVDWLQRDKEMTLQVIQVVTRLKAVRKLRVSKSEIGRQIGALSLISNRLENMPQTQKELDKVVESTEQYQLRRVGLSVQELKKRFHIVKGWKVAKFAGLRTIDYWRLKGEISYRLNKVV